MPKDLDQAAKDLVALLHGDPGPFLETESSFFGKKRVDPSQKDAYMETDCGGAIITKGKMTYGEADALAASVDLTDYPAFVAGLTPNAYWRSPYEAPQPPGVYFVGEVWWSLYSYLTVKEYICSMTPAHYGAGHPQQRGPMSYDNGMEYLYNEVLKRLVADGLYTPDPSGWWYTLNS